MSLVMSHTEDSELRETEELIFIMTLIQHSYVTQKTHFYETETCTLTYTYIYNEYTDLHSPHTVFQCSNYGCLHYWR